MHTKNLFRVGWAKISLPLEIFMLMRTGAAIALLLFVAEYSHASGPYFLIDIGTLEGGINHTSDAADINEMGQVVGRSASSNGIRAVLWTPTKPNGTTGSMINLGALAGDDDVHARAINSQGQVVGSSNDFPQQSRAFLWNPISPNASSGSMTDLGNLGGDVLHNLARGINELGQVTGYTDATRGTQAFLWTPNSPNGATGSMVALDGAPSGFDYTAGTDINSLGQVVGAVGNRFAAQGQAFLWTPSSPNGTTGSMITLGGLPGGLEQSSANAINTHGQVVGVGVSDEFCDAAFLWTPTAPNGSTGSMVSLGSLPGINNSRAEDINSQGQVVGFSEGFNEDSTEEIVRAFVWTPLTPNGSAGGLVDLHSLVTPASGAGWTLHFATGINDFGQIVGSGTFDPDGPGGIDPVSRGFLLTPVPEPSSVFVAGLGAAFLAFFVHRRRHRLPVA